MVTLGGRRDATPSHLPESECAHRPAKLTIARCAGTGQRPTTDVPADDQLFAGALMLDVVPTGWCALVVGQGAVVAMSCSLLSALEHGVSCTGG